MFCLSGFESVSSLGRNGRAWTVIIIDNCSVDCVSGCSSKGKSRGLCDIMKWLVWQPDESKWNSWDGLQCEDGVPGKSEKLA